MERKIEVGRKVRHFKGHWYRVEGVAKKASEKGKLEVVYSALYTDEDNDVKFGDMFTRDYDEFMSATPNRVHPDSVKLAATGEVQPYRFMSIAELEDLIGLDETYALGCKELFKSKPIYGQAVMSKNFTGGLFNVKANK